MKVLHISGARSWGGNEQQMIDFIPDLQSLGVHNSVFGVKDSPLHSQCIEKGIEFIEAKSNKLNKFANYRYLKQLVKEHKPNAIHLHTSDSLTVFTMADLLFRLKTKAVFSKKGMGSSSSILSKFKYNYKNVAYIICVSNAVKESFKSILGSSNHKKMVVVYDGINLERVSHKNTESIRQLFAIPQNKHIIGNIANHVKAKDLPTLIKSIGYLVYDLHYKNVHMVQMGKPNEKYTPEIEQTIKDLNVEGHITLAGFLDNASGYLPQFMLYVMSSEREGLPLTIYEAFLNNVPVVSTKAGGIPEAITDGQNGFLCETGDYKALAHNIKSLLEDESKRALFAQRSYDLFYQKYTSQKTAANTLQLYKQLV